MYFFGYLPKLVTNNILESVTNLGQDLLVVDMWIVTIVKT